MGEGLKLPQRVSKQVIWMWWLTLIKTAFGRVSRRTVMSSRTDRAII